MRSKLIYAFLAFIGIILFTSSFSNIDSLREMETWVQTTGTVLSAEETTYRNTSYDPDEDPSEEEYLSDVTYIYEFAREDGTTETVEDEITGYPSARGCPVEEGEVVDVIYDPDGTGVEQRDLPDRGDYIMVYVSRVITGALLVVLAVIGVKWIYKKGIRRLKYDSGSRRIL